MKRLFTLLTIMMFISACSPTPSATPVLPTAAAERSTDNPSTTDTAVSNVAPTSTNVPTTPPTETPIAVTQTPTPQTFEQWVQTSEPDPKLLNDVLTVYATTLELAPENIQTVKEIYGGGDGPFAVLLDQATGIPLFVTVMSNEGEPVWQKATIKSLAEKAGFKFGVEGLDGGNDTERFRILKEQFNQMTITGLSWKRSQPSETELVLTIPQSYLGKALSNGQTPTFQHLVYGNSGDTPDWLRDGNYSKEQAIKIMQEHVTNVMLSNKAYVESLRKNGTIPQSDIKLQYVVVNEAVNEPGYYWPQKIGPEYVELAFQTARDADPEAVLLYNDYGHELPTLPNANPVFDLVKTLKDKELIDGVGMQMHFLGGPENLDPNMPIQELEGGIRAQIERYAEIGVKVHITELDVDLAKITGTPEEQMQKAAEIYRMVSRVCAGTSNCRELTVFGMNSEFSWVIDLGGSPALLFSKNKPLPTFYAALGGILDALRLAQK